ncbi:MaoC family dehydratase [Nitrosopumilus sp.]|uniref:MaoC family dehydratase n=1 Tax=Nitrosopumilus sp. TaxID=2024843 RepID=UPI00242CB139|nr:MaoC family dehydratase [Nitrosopumilus sp.]MCV0366628.1 MaoC family dehydratase [Nitrosopumilus sp.]MCV0410551.1 MaoC family dehydratase [Nitrosopumilus sp.]
MTDSPAEYSFDDLFVGQKTSFSKKIDESLLNDFAKISGDFNPLHMNEKYAINTNFGKRVCHGMLLASFFSQLVGMNLPGKNSLYFSQTLNFRNPCFIDDEVTIEGEIIEKKSSIKLITMKTIIHNQTGKCIVDGVAKVIVRE